MTPEDRAALQRMLAEQAEAASATGDMRFLGSATRIPPRPPEPNFWEDVPQGNMETLPANLWRYGLTPPNEWGSVGWDRDLTMEQMLNERGIEGWRNIAAQIGLGVVEPGASEFGALARGIGSIAATVPRELLEAFVRAASKTNPHYALRAPSWAPSDAARPGYHGSPRVYGEAKPSGYGDWGAGFYWTDEPVDASEYANGMTKATRGLPDAAPNVRSFYPTGKYLDVHGRDAFSADEANRIVMGLERAPIWRSGVATADYRVHDIQDMARRGTLTHRVLYDHLSGIVLDYYQDVEAKRLMQAWQDSRTRRGIPAGIYESATDDWLDHELGILRGRARNQVNDILHGAGFDGLWTRGESVAFDPEKTLIPTWDADAMLRFVERVSPEEAERLRGIVDQWKSAP